MPRSTSTQNPRFVDFYWEIGSTNSYFALKLIQPVLQRTGATLRYFPFNLGHVFRTHNYVLMDEPASKIANRKRDLARWAEKYGFPFRFPTVFPIKTSRILRGSLAMRRWKLEEAFIEGMMTAYWEQDDAAISDYPGMAPYVRRLGIDPGEFESLSESGEIRQQLIDITNEGLARGVFGVPSLIVGDELFWGKDRMEFVEDELRRQA